MNNQNETKFVESTIKEISNTIKNKFINTKPLYLALILATIIFVVSYYYFQEFLAINAGGLFGLMIVATTAFLDTAVLKLNTYEEIIKGNIAYAIVFLSITLSVVFGYLIAFMAFLK